MITTMETLAPRAAYDDELWLNRHLLPHFAVLFGAGMGVFELVEGLIEGDSLGKSLFIALGMAVIYGLFASLVFPLTYRWGFARLYNGLYEGAPRLVPAPDPAYAYRLPSEWMHPSGRAVAGVLYVGRRGIRFDPHLRNWRRYRQSAVLEPLEQVELTLVHGRLPLPMRLWSRRTVPRIEARRGGESLQFDVPTPADTLARLRERLAELRSDHGEAGVDQDRGASSPPAGLSP